MKPSKGHDATMFSIKACTANVSSNFVMHIKYILLTRTTYEGTTGLAIGTSHTTPNVTGQGPRRSQMINNGSTKTLETQYGSS